MLRVATYNLHQYGQVMGGDAFAAQLDRFSAIVRDLDADVVLVQEIVSASSEGGSVLLQQLAEASGLACVVPVAGGGVGQVALGAAGSGYHTGILWDPATITPVPGSVRSYGVEDGLHHALVVADLEVPGGGRLRFGSYHADPFRPGRRVEEALRVASAFRRGPAGVLGGDFNNIGADRSPRGGFYDPDPFAALPWDRQWLFQCEWAEDTAVADGGHRADRGPGHVLRRAGLVDAAAVLDVPWEPTAGHRGGGIHPARRIDGIRVSAGLVPALRSHRVVRTAQTVEASDHLPVVVELDPAALTAVLTAVVAE